MAEKLFSRLRQVTANNSFRFEVRLLFMNLISRLIGVHRLMLLNFYDFMIPYLKPHQKEVTSIIAFVAQSSHELVPPDVLEVVVQAMADNFVWSNCASEVITAGLNGLREICVRCPLAMPETLLQSLIDDYKNHREKGPMNAARSLLGLYREVNPEMLKKKDRGKSASMNMKTFAAPQYGHVNVSSGVEGAEFLNEKAEETSQVGSDDEEAPLLVDGEEELEESGTEGEEELEEDDLEPVSGDEDEDSVAFEEIEGEEILSDDEEAENAGDSVPDDTEAKEPALKKVKQTQMIDKVSISFLKKRVEYSLCHCRS